MDKNSKIYVAGHNGLVGTAITEALKRKGYTNIVGRTFEELDLRRQADTEAFFAQEKPEAVILALRRSEASWPTTPSGRSSSTRT